MNVTITCHELQNLLAGDRPPVVIDVLPPEVFAVRRLAGACNVCVYEVVFLEGSAAAAPDRGQLIVLYDDTGTTGAAVVAREKLLASGYSDVRILEGGMAGWAAAGYPVEQGEAVSPEPKVTDGAYRLDTEASVLEWTGRNINNRHYGRIPFAGGELEIAGGELVRGVIVLDMTGIDNLDLRNEGYRQMLISHLKSDDFFDVARHPAAVITLTGWQKISGASPGTPDHLVAGDLTIKGVTRPVGFPAVVTPQQDGTIKAQATFDIDRTQWNITYGSGRLFEKLGMHLVHDRIDIELFLLVRPAGLPFPPG